MRSMPSMRSGRQAGQASIGQELPQPPDGDVGLLVKVHLKRVSHPYTLSDEPQLRRLLICKITVPFRRDVSGQLRSLTVSQTNRSDGLTA
jgi:hypothetical protein